MCACIYILLLFALWISQNWNYFFYSMQNWFEWFYNANLYFVKLHRFLTSEKVIFCKTIIFWRGKNLQLSFWNNSNRLLWIFVVVWDAANLNHGFSSQFSRRPVTVLNDLINVHVHGPPAACELRSGVWPPNSKYLLCQCIIMWVSSVVVFISNCFCLNDINF
jgi:hypothetical protein